MTVPEDKVNILVIDDLPEKLLAMELILRELGQNVVTARSGREGLRRLLEQDFAVILLDVNMPDMDGFETAQMIRQRRRSTHTPIIFITAFSDEMHAAQSYRLGAVDYILSPVIPEVLRTKVKVFVELFRKTEQVKRQAEERVALAQEQAARAAAEEVTRRSLFLAEASTVLANSLDFEATVRGLLRVTVPTLADLAAVTVAADTGPSWWSEVAWRPPDGGAVQSRRVGPDDVPPDELRAAVERALAGGGVQALNGLDLAFPAGKDSAPSAPAARLHCAAVLPLRARGRTLGVLALARAGPARPFSTAELALAGDLAGRAAVALDNARLYREIQESDAQKNAFLAMLAHELRNPLAPIRNALHIMQQPGVDRSVVTQVREMMQRQVQHMTRLVDDLLDVSRFTRGKIELRKEVVALASVVTRTLEANRPLFEERCHELEVVLPPEPVFLEADPTRLEQILANLLNNAAKYTDNGGHILLAARREGDELVVRVKDTGMGLAADMLSRVFEPFVQCDRVRHRSQGGLGIGLTLVRSLVEMHGGTVRSYSDGPGKGSEFVVRLPVLPEGEADGDVAAGESGEPPEAAAGRSILVVDDNVDAAESLAMLLRLEGHAVRVVHDGPGALAAVESDAPDVVFLDLGMPIMSGYEVARQIRQRPETESPILVAVTGWGQEEDRRRSQEAGFHHHLVKPVDPESLRLLLALPEKASAT